MMSPAVAKVALRRRSRLVLGRALALLVAVTLSQVVTAEVASSAAPDGTMVLAQAAPKAKAGKRAKKGRARRAGPRPRATVRDGSSALPKVGPTPPSAAPKVQEPRLAPRATTKPVKTAKAPKARTPKRPKHGDPEDLARGALLITIAGLYVHWRKTSRSLHTPGREDTSGGETVTPFIQHHARPVFLEPHTEVDPATRNVTDIFQRPGAAAASKPAEPVPEAYEDSNDRAAEDLEAIAQIRIASGLKPLKGGGGAAFVESPLVLPSTLAAHFRGMAGESLAWTGRLSLPLPGVLEGTLAITTERILASYSRRMLDLLPPAWISDQRRHQMPLKSVTGYGTARARQPMLLAVGAALALWWPFGSAVAAAAVVLFFVWTRAELAVDFGASRRQYPLSPPDLETARAALASELARKSQKAAQAAQPGKKIV